MWAPHGYSTGTATAGRGAQAAPTDMHMRAHAHALPGVHMHTHTEQSPPPSHGHPAPPSPAQYRGEHPLPPGGSGGGWQGAISMVWGLLAPAAPRCCRARRGRPHTGHPVAGREKRSCARQGVDGGAGGCRGAVGARGHPGVRGQGTVAGLGEEQHAGGEWPHENTCHAGRGVQALAKTGIPPPNDVPGTPHMGLGGPRGGVPPPARTGGGWSPFM